MQCSLLVMMAVALAVAEGAQSLERLPENKDHPGKCVQQEKGLIIDVGKQENPLGQCLSYSCSHDTQGFLLTTSSCGAIGIKPPCYLSQKDTTKRYPECCPSPICPKELKANSEA